MALADFFPTDLDEPVGEQIKSLVAGCARTRITEGYENVTAYQ